MKSLAHNNERSFSIQAHRRTWTMFIIINAYL